MFIKLKFIFSIKCFASISRVKQKFNKSLVDRDPGKCYTSAKKAKCVLCFTKDVQNTSEAHIPRNKLHLLRETGSRRHEFSPSNFRS